MSSEDLRSRIKVQFLDKHVLNFPFHIFQPFIRIFTKSSKAQIVSSTLILQISGLLKIFIDCFLETGDVGHPLTRSSPAACIYRFG